MAKAYADLTVEEFDRAVADLFAHAVHPLRHVHCPELVFEPVRELMDALRTSGFSVATATSGGSDFLGVMSDHLFRIPPELVVGRAAHLRATRDGAVRRCDSLDPPAGAASRPARRRNPGATGRRGGGVTPAG